MNSWIEKLREWWDNELNLVFIDVWPGVELDDDSIRLDSSMAMAGRLV